MTHNKSKIKFLISTLLLLAILATGCRRVDSTVYSRFERIPDSGWQPSDYISFLPYPADSILNEKDRFALFLHVRYNSGRASGPLRMILLIEDGEGYFRSDTISLDLFSKNGSPLGKGSRNLYELRVPLDSGFRLSPGLLVSMRSLTPASRTRGILDLGLSMSILPKNTSDELPSSK